MTKLALLNSRNAKLPKKNDFLWRYYDIHKFLNLLQNKKFRFSRMDKFEDPLEGIPLSALLTYRTKLDLNLIQGISLSELILDPRLRTGIPDKLASRLRSINAIQKSTFVTCWFADQRESLAMWNLYSNPDGVALKIPFGLLTNKLKLKHASVSAFYGGMVMYQDFDNVFPNADNSELEVKRVALRKDDSFKHECEFRLVARVKDHRNELSGLDSEAIDLHKMKMKVVCHPRMAEWKKNNIRTLLEQFGLESAFEKSSITLRG